MKAKFVAIPVLASGILGHQAYAALKITEVLFNEVGSDVGGEWIEIYNTGSTTIDLSNYKIGDEETSGATSATESMWQFPTGASIAPGEVQIVANNADRFSTVYGFLPTYETNGTNTTVPNLSIYSTWDPDGNSLNMANANDQALILGPDDTIVDAVSWGNTFAFDPGLPGDGTGAEADGQSWERVNALIDTDAAADWQLVSTAPEGAAWSSQSNPGTVTIPEPASISLMGLFAGLLGRHRR